MCIKLKGIDAEIFQKNLERELIQKEINEVRKWAGLPVKKLTDYFNEKE